MILWLRFRVFCGGMVAFLWWCFCGFYGGGVVAFVVVWSCFCFGGGGGVVKKCCRRLLGRKLEKSVAEKCL